MNEHHRARKRFGQNFLTDENVVHRIAAAIAPAFDDHLVEIGPGRGALTGALLQSGCRLDAVELDRDLIAPLTEKYADSGQFRLHQGDALRFDFGELAEPGQKLRVVGNLPYNISTPVLFHLLGQAAQLRDMHFMLQLEVVQRLGAGPGSKSYGRLGVMIQHHCDVQPLFEVSPQAFSPAPKVRSAVVRLTPRHLSAPVPAALDRVLRQAFAARRKTLRNALRDLAGEDLLRALDIDPGARPETLSPQQFLRIAEAVEASQ